MPPQIKLNMAKIAINFCRLSDKTASPEINQASPEIKARQAHVLAQLWHNKGNAALIVWVDNTTLIILNVDSSAQARAVLELGAGIKKR